MLVSDAAYQLIRQGNTLRSAGDWRGAAEAYQRTLAISSLPHIWLQLGHARGETGDWRAANDAYRQAIEAGADPGEVWLHIGHARKRAALPTSAYRAYRMAAAAGNDDAAAELIRALALIIDPDDVVLDVVRTHGVDDDRRVDIGGASEEAGIPIAYDISDLVSHFRHHRLPTGIQRLQIEILSRSLDSRSSRICCFVSGQESLVEIAAELFSRIVHLARQGSDDHELAWRRVRAELFLGLMLEEPFEFRENEYLVNLGTSWWIYSYPLFIRDAKAKRNIRFATLVFDLIPVLASGLCVRGIAEDYVNWLIGSFDYTDLFICISKSTAKDLIRVAAQLGVTVLSERVTVFPLDADFRAQTVARTDLDLGRYGLSAKEFVLCVSTIEARKNHILALRAWRDLIARSTAKSLPLLVFAGRNGWLNSDVYQLLADDPVLRSNVVIIESASDADLAQLYRHCLFTLYPSLYEGWGLPVTESLCYGKLPVAAANSSLPEAGGEFAEYFESDSVDALIGALERPLRDRKWLQEREALIAREFKPRSWSELANQLMTAVAATPVAHAGEHWYTGEPGRFHRVGRHTGTRIWHGLKAGERYRAGAGWHWPDMGGCATRRGRAALRVALPPGTAGKAVFYVLLRGLESEDCPYQIVAAGLAVDGTVEAHAVRWGRPLTVVVPPDGRIEIAIEGTVYELREMLEGGKRRQREASIGVVGFVFILDTEESARANLFQTLLLGDLESIDVFGEPQSSPINRHSPAGALVAADQ